MIDVRPLAESDRDQAWAVNRAAFGGPAEPGAWWAPGLDASHPLAAYDGGRVGGFLRVKPYRQWFGGRAVPMGGIASVSVAATHAGRGVAQRMAAAAVPLMHERGYAVSTLFPATTALYRKGGWGIAGDYTWVNVPPAALRALGPGEVRAITPDDVPRVLGLYERLCRESSGLLDRTGPFFDHDEIARQDVALLHADGYALASREAHGHHVDLTVWDVVALTSEAARALWFGLGAGASWLRQVRANAAPDTLALVLAEPPGITVDRHDRWMLRVVDLPSAVAARGWPHVSARVDVHLADDLAPWHDGPWRLAVDGGAGTATRGGDGTVRLSIAGLAALYTGYADPRTLRRAGLLDTADEAALDALATMTAGPRPALRDYF